MDNASRSESRRKVVWGGRTILLIALLGALTLIASCGDAVRQGTGSSYLILTNLTTADSKSTLASDVIADDGTVFQDGATASFQLGMKDSTLTPTPNNFITINRYHVQYVRSDGHNVQGVDVPFAFDGASTVTVAGSATLGFTLVRVSAKEEAPLKTLRTGNQSIATIAQVTFFGQDQTGHDVSVNGNIEVTFANWGG